MWLDGELTANVLEVGFHGGECPYKSCLARPLPVPVSEIRAGEAEERRHPGDDLLMALEREVVDQCAEEVENDGTPVC